MYKQIKIILLLLFSVSKHDVFCQNRVDSIMSVYVGNKFSYDCVLFYSDSYKREDYSYRPSFTNSFTTEVQIRLGKNRRFCVSIEPEFGYKQVSFKAITPNRELVNRPDTLIVKDNGYFFYKNQKLLPKEYHVYRKSYWKTGCVFMSSFRINSKNVASIGIGINTIVYNNSNSTNQVFYRSFSGSVGQNNSGYFGLFKQDKVIKTKTFMIALEHIYSKRISFRISIETNSDAFTYFKFSPIVNLNFFRGDVIQDCYTPSLSVTLKYKLL